MNKVKVTCSSLCHLADTRLLSEASLVRNSRKCSGALCARCCIIPRLVKLLLNDGKRGPVWMGGEGDTKD